jgi:hypothetical protein
MRSEICQSEYRKPLANFGQIFHATGGSLSLFSGSRLFPATQDLASACRPAFSLQESLVPLSAMTNRDYSRQALASITMLSDAMSQYLGSWIGVDLVRSHECLSRIAPSVRALIAVAKEMIDNFSKRRSNRVYLHFGINGAGEIITEECNLLACAR